MPLIRALLQVDNSGQLTIPANVVKALNIKPGQHAELRLLTQNKIQLMPQEKLSSNRKLHPKKQGLF
jgi:bifunctional DNA-binding transcriptional regulator/antitoxin component of YhaV-PrlF toxin-antitoxin module